MYWHNSNEIRILNTVNGDGADWHFLTQNLRVVGGIALHGAAALDMVDSMCFSRTLSLIILSAAAAMLVACGSNAVDAPPLASPGGGTAAKSNWFQGAGDAAWNEVASPIGGLVPKPGPRATKVEAEPLEQPETILLTRENRGLTIEGAATSAPATVPATLPATQP